MINNNKVPLCNIHGKKIVNMTDEVPVYDRGRVYVGAIHDHHTL